MPEVQRTEKPAPPQANRRGWLLDTGEELFYRSFPIGAAVKGRSRQATS